MALDVLIDEATLQARITQIAEEVSRDFADGVLLVAILKGSVHFLSDLARKLTVEAQLDFMSVSSYGAAKQSSGIVQIRKDLDASIEGRDVLIVEDIVDTGKTLAYLQELLQTRNPRSLRTVALLSKPSARTQEVPVEYIGFPIADEFVVGYGLDFAERYRNLPYIAVLRDS